MALFAFLWMLGLCLCSSKQKKETYSHKVKRKFVDAMIRIALTFDTPVCMSFFLNLREATFAHALDIVSFISAVFVMLLFIIMPIFFGWKLIKNKQRLEDEDFKDIYGGFYDGFRTDCNWSILFY